MDILLGEGNYVLRGIIGDVVAGQFGVGDVDDLVVRRDQPGREGLDFLDGSRRAGAIDIVAGLERLEEDQKNTGGE